VWSDADRLTSRGTDTFGYDALDRMTSSNVAGTARTYTYNGDGLLQTRSGGVGATFLWDASSSPSRELKQNNDNIIYGLGPLYVVKADATTVSFARDGSKNVRAEVSSAAAVTAAFRYRAYGQLAQASTAAPAYLGLASQLFDPSGLYYMRARWYDPGSGRFLARDPVRGDAASPMTLNAYAYAAADPIRLSDPTGMRWANDTTDCASPTCEETMAVAPASSKPKTSLLDELTHNVAGGLLNFTNAVLFGPSAQFNTGADGVEFVNNASGVMGTLTGVFNWGAGSTTFSANLVVSNDTPDTWRMTHERGHTEQAKRLGPMYLIGYASAWTLVPGIELGSVLAGNGLMDLHTAHPYEWDATYRMGLGNTWR
jgi:RHS repeat-associated protein